MTRSTQTGSQVSLVRIPTVDRLDFDALMSFATTAKKKLPSSKESEAIQKFMQSDPNFRELSRLHHHFIEIKNNYNLLLGLTPQQVQELQALIKYTRTFKELRKNTNPTVKDLKDFLANEKRMVPLTQIVDWWTHNCEALQKLEVWENIAMLITSNGKQNQEESEITKNKLHQLTDLKNEWISHQFFAGYSSTQLITFYTDFLVKMETWIYEYLSAAETPENKKPPLIRDYLNYLLNQLRELKRHAINSMIARLRCAEVYHDLAYDDLLVFICEQIKQNCGATLLNISKIPGVRKSSSPQIASTFVNLIATYLKANPNESSISQSFKSLRINIKPNNWATMFDDDVIINNLMTNPIAVYIENLLPNLLTEINANPNITVDILQKDQLSNKTFELRKLRRLMNYNRDELNKLIGKKLDATQIALEKVLTQQLKKYNYLINEIHTKINIELQKEFRGLWDDIFSDKEITSSRLDTFIQKIKNANNFHKKYLNLEYNAYSDIILQLASRLKGLLAKNLDIMPGEIKNILKLFLALSAEQKNADLDELKKILAKLPETAQKLNEENEGELLHLLIHFIESSQLNREQLRVSLSRHKHIASVYGERWDETFKITPDMNQEQMYVYDICSYIKNVMLKIIHISPYIDFSNFDNNEMRTTIINIENDYRRDRKAPLLQKQQFDDLQNELQKRILFKLNDLFLIKSYLYLNETKAIDVEKLKTLLTRINCFFTNTEYKTAILDSITKAVRVLLKNYSLHILQHDADFNREYIYSLNTLFNENLLLKLGKDDELLKTLKTYIETYNGSRNTISTFLVELIPKNNFEFCDNYILPYARKRLDYIKSSRDASDNDYLFFVNYAGHSGITKLMNEAKSHFKDLIQSAASNQKQPWSKNTAYLVELFGTDQALYTYRLKRITELLQNPELAQLSQQKLEEIFQDFLSSINQHRLYQRKVIPLEMQIYDNMSFQQYLDKLTSQQEWTYLQEKILSTCGTEQQLNLFHFNLSMHLLDKRLNGANTWLFKFMKSAAESYQSIDKMTGTDNSMEKNFYLNFYGEANLKKLCLALEQLLMLLAKANLDFSTKELDKEDYKNLTAMIGSVKPFARIYAVCGNNPDTKTAFENLNTLENKLCLHYKLNTVLKRQTSLLNISNENSELHNLILTIIDTIRKIENRQIVNEQTINDYLVFFDKEILTKIDTILEKHASTISFKVLYHLSNLIVYLASDNMKMLLLDGNAKNCLVNPHWLHLINHFDKRKELNEIEQTVNDSEYANTTKTDFQNILNFSKHMSSIKHKTHSAIKRQIFKEADIVIPLQQDASNISNILQGLQISDAQCIKLWISCASKLQNNQIDSQFRVNYLNFLIKFLVKISNLILNKSQNNPGLLTELIQQFPHIYQIKNRVTELSKESDKINSPRNPNEFFHHPIELEKTLQPLFVIIDKALALQLIHRINKFVLKIVKPKQLDALRLIYSDTKYADTNPNAHGNQNQAAIKFALGIHNESDLAKLTATLGIYHMLQNVVDSGHSPAQLTSYIDFLIQESTKHPILRKSHSYTELLSELRDMSIRYFSLQENRSALFQFTHKSNFTLSTK